MPVSTRAEEILSRLGDGTPKMGDIKAIAKEIKKDHDLALELWATGKVYPRMLAVLVMDKKLLTQEVLDGLAVDVLTHESDDRNRITEWLLANQLMKDKKTVALMETWQNAESPVLRRLFWYHQARLRWNGQTSPENTAALLESIDKEMANEVPEVQWTMNFTAGWIGVYDKNYREEVIEIGKRVGLYFDEVVPRNCTPNYLPAFVETEVAKIGGARWDTRSK
jgi:3-methyladenine DNA glycosylase AlkD